MERRTLKMVLGEVEKVVKISQISLKDNCLKIKKNSILWGL